MAKSIGFSLLLLLAAISICSVAALKCIVDFRPHPYSLEEQEGQQQQAEHVQYQLLPDSLLSMTNIAKMQHNYSNPRPGPPEEFDFITNCITVLCNHQIYKMAIAVPSKFPDNMCNKIKWTCTDETKDPKPYCKLCDTADCNQ